MGNRGLSLLRNAGHDVETVREEGLGGASDEKLFSVCCREGRALLTLDHDFGHVLRFPPERSAGLVILETPGGVTPRAIEERMQEMLSLLTTQSLDRHLWIVEPGRIRIHSGSQED
ncbi:MAG: DUF5615 family PIN-like protein [Bdellovibrionota bacterium]